MKIAIFLLASASAFAVVSTPANAQESSPDPSLPTAQQPPAPPASEDIVITGLRAGQIRALTEKRAADNTVEALFANDVGKLPDQNIAEAVKRLPGLSVVNDQGEGRYIVIRGIDPNLINVTLNGQTLPAPEPDGRQVKLDDLPSAMIQSVVVTKSLLPSQDANAIGGEVAIRTKSAFDDPKPFFFNARGALGWYAMNHKHPYELDAQAGGRFGPAEQFGAVVSVNYSRRPIQSQNFQGTDAFDVIGGVAFPDQGGIRDYNLIRTRLGIVANLDYRPSDAVKIYLRSSYSKFKDEETRDQNRLDSITFVDQPAATGDFTARGSVLVRRREEDDNTKSLTLGGDFGLGLGSLAVSGGWTRAEKEDPIRSEFRFRTGSNRVAGTYDVGADPFIFDPFFGSDLTRYNFNSFNLETRQAHETIWQGRADYTLPVSADGQSTVQLGGKYLARTKKNNQDRVDFGAGDTPFTLDQVSYLGDSDFYDGRYTFGPRIDYDAARAFLDANPGASEIDDEGTIADTLASDYLVKERILAAYAMATLHYGTVTVIPGVRIEHTHDDVSAKVVDENSTLTDGFNSNSTNSYTNFFPGLNVKWEAAPNVIVRGAATTSIARPSYALLAPFVLVEPDDVPSITLGNPDLKPYKAINLDASVEYYPTTGSILAVGLFHKWIKDPIYSTGTTEENVTFAGITYPEADITRQINADKETVTGIELNAQYQFTMLPGFLSGFGVSANFAHIWGHASAPDVRPGDIPLFFQSKNVANLQLFYEKYGLAARLAYNFRSHYLDSLGGSPDEDQFTDKNGQLDFHVSYELLPQVTIFGDATNLTDAPWRRYVGSKDLLIERERYDYQLRAGIQVHI